MGPIILLIKYLTYCASNSKKRHYKFPRIRYNDEVPKDIIIIIRGLTTSNMKDRLSVRACYRRLFALDNENNGDNDNNDGVINNHHFDVNVITYLKCSTKTTATTRSSDTSDATTNSEIINENEDDKILNPNTIICT